MIFHPIQLFSYEMPYIFVFQDKNVWLEIQKRQVASYAFQKGMLIIADVNHVAIERNVHRFLLLVIIFRYQISCFGRVQQKIVVSRIATLSSLLQDRESLDKNDPKPFICWGKTTHYDIPTCFTVSRTNYNRMIYA